MAKRRILIADEHRSLAELLSLGCEELGFDTRVVFDGAQLIEQVLDFQPDLVCLDANLRDGAGTKLCEAIAVDPRCFGLPLIVLSGIGSVPSCRGLYGQYVLKTKNVWSRIEELIVEMFDLSPNYREDLSV